MIDLQLKLAVAAAVAWILTRKVTPANAANAHRLWLVVIASPFLWLAGPALIPPVVIATPREGVIPSGLLDTPQVSATLLAVYVLVAACLLVRLALGVRSVHCLLRHTRPVDPTELAAGCSVREGDLDLPVTAGFLRPVIVLPANWRTLSPAALEAILRHEAAHVRRKDCAVSLACALMEALLWFNPAVWIAAAKVRWFAEMACDADAARGMNASDYAAALLNLAARWTSARRPQFAITAGAETKVSRRIHLLLDELERGGRRRVLLPIVAGLLIIGMPMAAAFHISGTSVAKRVSAAPVADHALIHGLRHHH